MKSKKVDKLFIRGLSVSAKIGILPWERENRQTIQVDLECLVDVATPAASDAIEDAVDYAAIREHAIAFIQHHQFNLVETLAERLSSHLMERFQLSGCRLSVSKPSIFEDVEAVGVTIQRGDIV